jgi:hypothetical protein
MVLLRGSGKGRQRKAKEQGQNSMSPCVRSVREAGEEKKRKK